MLAVSYSEFEKYGCPNCGCDYAKVGFMSGGGCTPVTCAECNLGYMVLADGIEQSSIGMGTTRKDEKGETIFEYPKRIPHPRISIPKHKFEAPDIRPEGEGDFWNSRGIGRDPSGKPDMSGFVKSRQAGERILEMVHKVLGKEKSDSWLDYREQEPLWIQFKFLSTEFDLEKLQKMVADNNDVITEDILTKAVL